jgi:hypothetical protein
LDVEIKKDNIMLPIENKRNKLSFPEYNFYGNIDTNYTELFRTEDIINNFPMELTFEDLYKKFNNVSKAEIHTLIIYNVNGKYKESKFIWKYNVKRRTSPAWFDTIMSV